VSITAISSHGGVGTQAGAALERSAMQAANPNSAGGSSATSGAGVSSASNQVSISFEPPAASNTPMDRLGSGLLDTLRDFEQTRSSKRDSMSQAQGGPASPISMAKDELLSGPASIRPAAGGDIAAKPADPIGFDDAVDAMTRSFDYAIETQLIVKTGSQFSTSASSLMRGQ